MPKVYIRWHSSKTEPNGNFTKLMDALNAKKEGIHYVVASSRTMKDIETYLLEKGVDRKDFLLGATSQAPIS